MLSSMLSDNAHYIDIEDLDGLNPRAADAAKVTFGDFGDEFAMYHDPTPKDTGRGEDLSNGSLWAFDGHLAWFWDGDDWMSDADNDDQD